jgi:hypothetical protein
MGRGNLNGAMGDWDVLTWVVVLGTPLLLGAGVLLLVRVRKSKPEPFYHFRCPNCKSRLRYQPRQVGHWGICSSCKERFTYPPVAHPERH